MNSGQKLYYGTLSGFMTTPILTGDNPVSTCQECGSIGKEWCTYNDMYAGGDGPMHCLKDGKAEVSFMRSTDLDYLTTSQYGNAPQFRADVSCKKTSISIFFALLRKPIISCLQAEFLVQLASSPSFILLIDYLPCTAEMYRLGSCFELTLAIIFFGDLMYVLINLICRLNFFLW